MGLWKRFVNFSFLDDLKDSDNDGDDYENDSEDDDEDAED